MKKKISILLGSLFTVVLLFLIFSFLKTGGKKQDDAIYIAAAGPMTGQGAYNGKEMLRGIEMYIDELNKKGGLHGKEVKLITFDDKNDEKAAMEGASEIGEGKKALVVLGNYYSEASVVAGKIYKRYKIPAITASATDEAVTLDNEWYFRVIPSNRFQAEFIANYISKTSPYGAASIIWLTSSYGKSLNKSFEEAAGRLGLNIKGSWRLPPDSPKHMESIVAELNAIPEPGIVFLAMHTVEAAKLITLLKSSGKDYTIVGPDSLSAKAFIDEMKKYPKEQAQPGYYSNGIFALAPFINGLSGGSEEYVFERKFFKRYKERPSWIAACYYDAANVAAEAIRQTEIQGGDNIRSDRKKVRETLASLYTYEKAVKGVTGPIYFDPNGDAERAPAMGGYWNQIFVPMFSQYQTAERKEIDHIFKRSLQGDIIIIGGRVMKNIRIVYSGLYINEITLSDHEPLFYTADFYIWFRYSGEFDDALVEFTDALEPVNLASLRVKELKRDDITIRIYRVKADFRAEFDFHNFPFDGQSLYIRLHHTSETKDRLIYLPEKQNNRPPLISEKELSPTAFHNDRWVLTDISVYQDMLSNVSSLGVPRFFKSKKTIAYSRLNADIRIKRKLPALKYAPGFIALVLVLCISHFIPLTRKVGMYIRISIYMVLLVANFSFHLNLLSNFPATYLTVTEYIVFTIHVLVMLSVFISLYKYSKKHGIKPGLWIRNATDGEQIPGSD